MQVLLDQELKKKNELPWNRFKLIVVVVRLLCMKWGLRSIRTVKSSTRKWCQPLEFVGFWLLCNLFSEQNYKLNTWIRWWLRSFQMCKGTRSNDPLTHSLALFVIANAIYISLCSVFSVTSQQLLFHRNAINAINVDWNLLFEVY